LHGWDLAESGIPNVLNWARDAHLNAISLATTYHHGWFLQPNNPRRRSFMPEGDVCYFHPDSALYKRTSLRPCVSRYAKKSNLLSTLCKHLKGLRLISWTIGNHNTDLGLSHPECTQQNVFGDRLPHALCPSNPNVREYLKALCRDLAVNYPIWAIQLEAFGWGAFAHGHHHERDLVGLSPFEQSLMAWCFCPACAESAKESAVDVPYVRSGVKRHLEAAFREAPQRPQNHPRSMDDLAHPAFQAFQRWRHQQSDSLVTAIRQESLKGTNCKLLLQSEYRAELAHFVHGFGCGAYQQRPAQVADTCRKAARRLPAEWEGLFQCFVQLGCGVPNSRKQLQAILAAASTGGCNGVTFYNRSESPPKMLSWVKQALSHFIK